MRCVSHYRVGELSVACLANRTQAELESCEFRRIERIVSTENGTRPTHGAIHSILMIQVDLVLRGSACRRALYITSFGFFV